MKEKKGDAGEGIRVGNQENESLNSDAESSIALIAITEHGVKLALQIQSKLPGSVCYVPERHHFALAMGARGFHRMKDIFFEIWPRHRALICIMATGIVVRLIAPFLKHKKVDPAVVVMDERGQFVISLLSGHLGGANRLASKIAQITGGLPVITTASDVQQKPAWDLIAQEAGLEIENMQMLPRLTRALLEDESIYMYDPDNHLRPYLSDVTSFIRLSPPTSDLRPPTSVFCPPSSVLRPPSSVLCLPSSVFCPPCVWVSECCAPAGFDCLELRPRSLVVGIGCNRGTPAEEILDLLHTIFQREGISILSIRNLASIDLKGDESGLLEAGKVLQRPISFYSKESIETVTVPNPSPVVAAHIGVPSVCEATALLSARSNRLIVPKQKTSNVTLAVAKVASPS